MKRLSATVAVLFAIGSGMPGCTTTQLQSSADAAAGWTTLFDGTDLNSWNRLGDGNWRLTEGLVQADLAGKDGSYLVSKKSYKDFEIRAEFWVDGTTNSGVFIRCADPLKITAANCYEVNIWDSRPDPSYGTGAIVNVAKVSPMPKAGGQWNTYEITAKGTQLTVILNGTKTVDVQDGKHKSGPIALQYGAGVVKDAGVVKFRKVLIKPL
jgi:hypothetical protein